MKKIIIVLIMMLGIMEYEPVKGQVTDQVLSSFKQQYPQESAWKWIVRNDTSIAEFKMDKSKKMAYYLPNGVWVKTETKIPWTKDLPVPVDKSWKESDLSSYYVSMIKDVKYPDKEMYVMKVQEDCGPDGSIPGDCLDIYKLYYNPDGSLVKKVHVGE